MNESAHKQTVQLLLESDVAGLESTLESIRHCIDQFADVVVFLDEDERSHEVKLNPDLPVTLVWEPVAEWWKANTCNQGHCEWSMFIPRAFQLHGELDFTEKSLANRVTTAAKIKVRDSLGMISYRCLFIHQSQSAPIINGQWDYGTKQLPVLAEIQLRSSTSSLIKSGAAKVLVSNDLSDAECDSLVVAKAFENMEDYANATSWYSQTVADDLRDYRDRWLAAYRAALCQQVIADPAEALNWAQIAFELWPDRIESVVLISRLLREGGEVGRARALLKSISEQQVSDQNYPYFDDDYTMNRYAELARCEYALKNYRRAVESVNLYTLTAFRMGYDPELLRLRDDAFQQWQVGQEKSLPSVDAQRNQFLIIVAFYNAGEYLKKCVESIKSQTYRLYKVIFIDDCSSEDVLAGIDLRGLNNYQIIRNKVRKGALANQVSVLLEHPKPSDIAVFLDGDDWFAHADVLKKLDELYRKTHCWASYGQARLMPAGSLGYARPVMPDEDVQSLFSNQPMMFPIHLRTHRAGLIQCLLAQDPDLNSFKNSDGEFLAHASDIAHMRVVFSLAGLSRIAFVPEVLYEYNTGNPLSHHRSSRKGLSSDATSIAHLPPLHSVSSYQIDESNARTNLSSVQVAGPAKLIVISIEGADPALIDRLIAEGMLPEFQSLLPKTSRLIIPEGYANDIFWRGIYTGQDPGEYAAYYRAVPGSDSYTERSCFDTPALASVNGFWNELALNGHRVALLNPVDVSLPIVVPGLTSLSNWMIHAPMDRPIANPPELLSALPSGDRYDDLLKPIDHWGVVDEKDVDRISQFIRRRQDLKSQLYCRMLPQGGWDLFSAGFDATHDALHKLWHFHDPESPYYIKIKDDPVVAAYQHTSQALQRLLADAGNSPVAVICGLGGRPNSSLNSILKKVVSDIESHLRGQLQPRQTDEKWFYQISSAPLAGAIRFNLMGRERRGRLSVEQALALTPKIKELLFSIKVSATGLPVVANVFEHDITQSTGYTNSLPDLVIHWANVDPGAKLKSDILGEYQLLDAQKTLLDFRTGDHNTNAAVYYNKQFQQMTQLPDELAYTELPQYLKQVVVDSNNKKQL